MRQRSCSSAASLAQRFLPPFKQVIDWSLFSPDTVWNTEPLLNVFTSVVALFLLALQSHEQDRETLSACSPLVDAVLMRPTRSDGSIVGSIVGRETMGAMLRRYGLAALLQFFWSIRVASVPVLALQGSAMLFASLPSAADIVLNSLAIAFVFELDSLLYATMLTSSQRTRYEESMEQSPSPLARHATKGATNIVNVYTWISFVIDFVTPMLAYLYYANRTDSGIGPDDPRTMLLGEWNNVRYTYLRNHILLRGLLLAIATIHVTAHVHTAAGAAPRRTWRQHVRLFANGCALLLTVLLAYTFVHRGVIHALLGSRLNVAAVSPAILDCVMMYDPLAHTNLACSTLHQTPGIYEELTQALTDAGFLGYRRERWFMNTILRAWASDYENAIYDILGWPRPKPNSPGCQLVLGGKRGCSAALGASVNATGPSGSGSGVVRGRGR